MKYFVIFPTLRNIALLITTISLTSCSMMHSINPKGHATSLVQQAMWQERIIPTSTFMLWSANKPIQAGEPLTIYLEGDGRISTSYGMATEDPSSPEPLALKLAVQNTQGNVAYIARPCHYMIAEDKLCQEKFWTTHRYSPEVITATAEAIQKLQQETQTRSTHLIGHSGGGGIAVLVAPKLKGITQITTLSGNLSLELMDKHHKTEPLVGSLDPFTTARINALIPQKHYSGSKDTVVPPSIAAAYVKEANSEKVKQIVVKGVDHWGWEDTNAWSKS